MHSFETSVLRERFTLRNTSGEGEPIVALSNRITIDLVDGQGKIVEKFVVRGQMLHTVVRMGATILNTFQRTGPILNRHVPVNWNQLWRLSAGDYELEFNPQLWGVVYHEGKIVYQHQEHHPFFDVIEQCDAKMSKTYDAALTVAENMFSKAGHPITIDKDTNIAMVIHVRGNDAKCGVMLRSIKRKTTFNFYGKKRDNEDNRGVNPIHFLNAAAAFLEGIQLAHFIGTGNEKMRANVITPYSPEGVAITSARRRLGETNAALSAFENTYEVHYRPERPIFAELVTQAEQETRKRLISEGVH